MKVVQVEHTPIGDYFHDNHLIKTFDELKNLVDEFELDSEDVYFLCDYLIAKLKEIKKITTKLERQDKITDRILNLD